MAIVHAPYAMRTNVSRTCVLCGESTVLAQASLGAGDVMYHSRHLNNLRECISGWATYRISVHLENLYEDIDNE